MGASFFLIFNAFIVIFLVTRIISFALGRSRPSLRDQMGAGWQKKPRDPKDPRGIRMEFFDIFTAAARGGKSSERDLSCPFVFEGAHYDAYEVLGVPAGAPRQIWMTAFGDLSRNSDSAKKKLLENAVRALESRG